MKFGTLVDLYEKLPNAKFEANLTSVAITNFGLEAKIGKIGHTQRGRRLEDSLDFSTDSDSYF